MTFSDNDKKPVENYNPGSIVASVVFIQTLISESAFINYLFTKQFTLHDNGVIQSENYSEGESGFRIKADGDAEFNDGKFRGHIEATSGTFHGRIEADEGIFKGRIEAEEGFFKGDLHAQFINIGGNVVAGTNFVLRSNDNTVITQSSSGTAKEIVTAAKGTATVRVRIGLGTRPNQYEGASYNVRLYVNNSLVTTFTPGTGYTSYTHEINITLDREVNVIVLSYYATASNTTFSTFQIMCRDNPRFLRFLG